MQARSRRTGITADRVVLELAELAFSNMFDFIEVHADGSVQIDLLRATRDRAAATRVLVVKGCAEGSGNEGGSVKLTRIQLCDKVKALDMLARHLGLYPMSERRGRRPTLSAR
jgi:phage terminase small subunit